MQINEELHGTQMTGNAWAGRDIEEKRKPRRSERGQRAVKPPQSLVWYTGLVRNSEVQLNHHKLLFPSSGSKMERKEG